MPCSLQALITTSSAAEPPGAAMYSTPLYTERWHAREEAQRSGILGQSFSTKCKRGKHILCVIFTRLARSMLSLKGKKASELTATACRELIQFFFSVPDRGSGTSSYIDFQTAKSGPCKHKSHKEGLLMYFQCLKAAKMRRNPNQPRADYQITGVST